MKRKFYQIAKKAGYTITSYKSFVSKGMGGLQVFGVRAKKGKTIVNFNDSYFHLSGDAPKVLKQFEYELNLLK